MGQTKTVGNANTVAGEHGTRVVVSEKPASPAKLPDLSSQPSLGALSKQVKEEKLASKSGSMNLPARDLSSRTQPLSKGVGRSFTRRRDRGL